ncbi:monovalent cation/H+ antiporter subunit A [Falsiroseomonas tokyonensis]|uniref:Monovalent cation/H+ antiporter subunit A n=1 Tax=Falsiroseomonas tokyonensis TaxID=430521 RepID=A0ABV7BWY8_9PROT|nr:monovalent cation/H+ antiporter subunit A [Falsiroseomonas tokyonensis]MBU8539147.1 monovalent cation/H+ antiporter subunit A [Falsiroseomonas tokyonensis]
MPDALLLLTLLVLPFLGSFAAGVLPRRARNTAAGLAGAIALVNLALVWAAYPTVAAGGVLRAEFEWMPSLGLNLVLRMDGFAWLFAGMVTGIGALVVLYARYYMSAEDPVPRIFAFLLAFMGAMTGLVMAGNLIQLAFFWELTSLFSFLLIGYWHHTAAARDGARMAMTITGAGGLALFAGMLVLGHIVGSYDLEVVLASGDVIRDHPLYLLALLLILLGALTKSAQFPFHFWLPHAMAAPTPVSAYLHSATLVKAGVFLLARLWPVMAGTEEWTWLVGGAGLITMLIGAYIAIFQNDLKGLLAYSTISHLGLITLLLGLKSELALVAAIFHILNHAAFKCSLFMAAGIIDHETGTRDIRRLSGLNRSMPFTARLALVAAAAMAGVPLLNGFISKEMFFAEALSAEAPVFTLLNILPFAAMLASAFSVTYSLRFIHGAFFGPEPTDLPKTPHEPASWMRFPVEILVLVCIMVGVLPAATVGPFLHFAAQSVLGDAMPAYSLSVWHGFNLPLLMSVLALAGGVVLYLLLQDRLRVMDGPPLIRRLEGRRIFERSMVFLSWRLARLLERRAGTQRLQPQLRLILGAAIVAGGAAVWLRGLGPGNLVPAPIDPVLVLIWAVGAACALGAAWQAKYHRLAALILVGGAGLMVCITFVWFSAPDLALTQLTVEIVTTVLLLLGLRWLPKRRQVPGDRGPEVLTRGRRARDLAIALGAGLGMAALSYVVMTRTPADLLAQHFLERGYTEGGGTNVVNVILVDFRGFDTLGEIFVVAAVALATFALLRRFRPAADSRQVPEQQRDQAPGAEGGSRHGAASGPGSDWLLVPFMLTRLVFPIMIVTAFFLLLRGHDLPGGGFSAGMVVAIAIILLYMVGGTDWTEDRLRLRPQLWIGTGLLLSTGTGLAAWAFSKPFLTSYFDYADLPVIGRIPVASALVFDIGVFALVVGATLLMLIALAHQSVRAHRSVPKAVPEPAPERPKLGVAGGG